ncbi:transglycosylase SLT domain-containing protein [Moraxella osloensis]|uniref:Lytic transglycosylase n=1 Tax=Faucicola osloensis TaxID=34062 RepID=A0A2D2LTN9_FAUOS|nr:transglycosylase SLT domain-containing protein [Moraxella osloensis]ATR78387.1 lytic transglycosylase [Moraxella osloensis]
MPLNSSFEYCDDLALTYPASISMSVKVFLSPLTLYPFQHPLLRFSKYASQFKRLQFFPIQFKPCLGGGMSPKVAQLRVPAVASRVQDLGQLANPSARLINLERFIKPLKWLSASKKLAAVVGIGLPLAYVATQMGVTDKIANTNANTLASPTSVVAAPKMATFDSILSQKQLRIATVNGNTTYFAQDGFEHGFGYDVMRHYAKRLDVTISTQVFATDADAMAAVQTGKADIALTNVSDYQNVTALSSLSLSCDKDYLSQQGLNEHVAIQLNPNDIKLNNDVKNFLCGGQSLIRNQHLAAFYSQTPLAEPFNQQHFADTMTRVLPTYAPSFKQTANKYRLDWELLVAMGYQESHLDAEATSPTGVRGIMMLTNATANAMGVANRTDPTQSIQGGAKYLSQLQQEFAQVPASDRVWFTLAAYNMGPQAIKDIQQILQKRGIDGNNWAAVYQYLKVNSQSNSRYVQCLDYVTHIRSYLEALKLDKVNHRQLT